MLVNLNEGCQLDCVFCRRNLFFDPEKRPSAREVVEMMEKSSDSFVLFSGGGEPTLCPNLVHYIRFAVRFGKRAGIETNGIMLSDMVYLKNLVNAGLKAVTITVPSHIPEVYDEVVGVNGSFEKIQIALENLSQFPQLEKKVNVPSTKLNMSLEHFKGLLEFLEKYGFGKDISFNCFRPNNSLPNLKKYLPDYFGLGREMVRILGYCHEKKVSSGVSQTTLLPLCTVPGEERTFSLNREFSTYYDYTELFTYLPECGGCAVKSACTGIPKAYLGFLDFRPRPLAENPLHRK